MPIDWDKLREDMQEIDAPETQFPPGVRAVGGFDQALVIRGNTYPVKDQLKAIGCHWEGQIKAWVAPDAITAKQARDLVLASVTGPRDVRNASLHVLADELTRRPGWAQAIGKARLIEALRAMGVRVAEEVQDTLGDLLVGEAPSIDELAKQIEELEKLG